ncbi:MULTISPECIES: lipocalin family protein [unclassified Acidocella]|uniref:lipocalin family protein n=1 Tax=unclassified Acidocella TaxID=2648610 RepID=UPI00028EDACD|nr:MULTISPECIES: lipocalin family protein [unclassified Acidocella]EKN01187.1 lipocalin [Acidocella sp. MX-AZ02]WBO60729.1 lipocalin family protein [Acidocella sp. MX-AZ03]
MRGWLLIPLLLLISGCAGTPAPVIAPQPQKPVEMSRLFTGTWYEIGRIPMQLTDGCVAGTTSYFANAQGQLMERDACRMHTPAGREKSFQGTVAILAPGANNKFLVRYRLWHLFTIPYTYWVLDHAADYSWFIVANPQMTLLSFFTRTPDPSPALVEKLTARVRALGYEGKLEYPARFPPTGQPGK